MSHPGMSAAPAVSGDPAISASTDAAQLPLSTISTAPAPAAEAIPHTGSLNALDPYVKEQFISQGSFEWTTADLVGKLIFSCPIHPVNANPILAYLSKIYNTWAGGLDFKAKIAGTGFHAGALALVRLPPNVDPATVSDVNKFTCFEYEIIDPKLLECVSRSVMDQRNTMYHYNPYDATNYNSFGGNFCIFVLQALNTSSSGSTSISVQIFSKASEDFEMLQIIPPNITTLSST
ncbi:hypothetical protein 2 [Hubei picorna-like virus 77]|uniref:hypothetical protein 2 n=1 Tax=Hubei picorna-like virus 77 TaxID=1923161 RepID=UPI00090ACC1F|nr:hypothetical protein 2 [Hubei picorna-like virus 77]APG78409.1 hypothetical protein 2 [Hubei picorna-like virus 77]